MEITKESKDNGDNQEKKEGKETSIYQRFKMNSHKIMIDVPNEGAFTDNKKNHKLEILKKRLEKGKQNFKTTTKAEDQKPTINILSKSLEEIPEKTNSDGNNPIIKIRNKSKDVVNLSTNLKEIENRILLKIKSNNKTDRKSNNNLNIQIAKSQNDNLRNNIYLKSPGSDKAESLFPIIANSSITSAYSTPYGKNTEQENDLKIGMSKEQIKEAMSRIKKSVARSQSIRNGETSNSYHGDDYSQNRRETPYDNHTSILNKSRINSESK